MKFLLDESVSKASAVRMRMLGHDVLRIGSDRRLSDDADIIELAMREQRILVTHDQDFGELVFKKRRKPPAGVILFRYEPVRIDEVARRLQTMIDSGLHAFDGRLTAVDEERVRQRMY